LPLFTTNPNCPGVLPTFAHTLTNLVSDPTDIINFSTFTSSSRDFVYSTTNIAHAGVYTITYGCTASSILITPPQT
jgi:hypothetical protein